MHVASLPKGLVNYIPELKLISIFYWQTFIGKYFSILRHCSLNFQPLKLL